MRVWIESPYAGDVAANVAYAREIMRWVLRKGFAPMCSHLVYTQPGILRDEVLSERDLGIRAGLLWQDAADELWIAIDRGVSSGMRLGLRHWIAQNDDERWRRRRRAHYISDWRLFPAPIRELERVAFGGSEPTTKS